MTMQDIKSEVARLTGIPQTLPWMMIRQTDLQDQPNEWVTHWDNDNRIRVSMHQDVLGFLKTDSNTAELAYYKQDVPVGKHADGTERKPYVRFIVFRPKVEATF